MQKFVFFATFCFGAVYGFSFSDLGSVFKPKNDSSSSTSDASSNPLSSLQNSSFGQLLSAGADLLTNNNNTSGISTNTIAQQLGNSSFGELVSTGIGYFTNLTNNTGTSTEVTQLLPFLVGAPVAAIADFSQILPKVPNITVNQFNQAVDAWAVKYNYTEQVNAYNARAANVTQQSEANAFLVVSNLDNVINNLKAINNNKDQTFAQIQNATITYLNSLDEPTRQIVFILFSNLLPPQLRSAGVCAASAGLLNYAPQAIGGMFQGLEGLLSGIGGTPNTQNYPIVNNFLQANNLTASGVGALLQGLNNNNDSSSEAEENDEENENVVTTKKAKKTTTKKNKKKTTTVAPAKR